MGLYADAGMKFLLILFVMQFISVYINADNMLIPARKRARNKKLACLLSMSLAAILTWGNLVSNKIVKTKDVKCDECLVVVEDDNEDKF